VDVPAPEPRLLHIPDPSLVVLVGAAGAGKTTFAARHFAPDEVLSSDAFRVLVAGAAADDGAALGRATGPAFAALHRTVSRRLAGGRLTVVDATSVQAHARRALASRAAAAGLPAVAIVLDLPPALVLARNAGRQAAGRVPDEAVRAQLAALWATMAGDPEVAWRGFAGVYRLASAADVDRVVVVRARAERDVAGGEARADGETAR
jgi:protein phosphatase